MKVVTANSESRVRLYSIGRRKGGTNIGMKSAEKMPQTVPSSNPSIPVSSPELFETPGSGVFNRSSVFDGLTVAHVVVSARIGQQAIS